MRYPWILFDADDTLFDFKRSARHALAQTLEDHKIEASETHFQIYETINHEVWLAFERLEITATELRKIRFERFLEVIGEYRDPLELNRYYLNLLSKTRFMLDGAIDLVESLHQKNYRMGLITNGLKEVQRPRIAQAKMDKYFEVIVVSDEIGVSKPHKGFFEYTYVEMGRPDKAEVIVVGDSLNSDIQGGINFGVDTCWFNPRGATNLTDHQPTYQIQKLDELWEIL
ncbi:MAG: noncanonical pyrimidine nucleotidase, YjjG family [Saprospiraceae bacterium]|nr:noncanonical pyrimidine nucleotidase, YjjG family [Saprospiraceae bacterium]